MNSDTLFWNVCIFSIFNNCCRSFPLLPQREDSKLNLLAQDHDENDISVIATHLHFYTNTQTISQENHENCVIHELHEIQPA